MNNIIVLLLAIIAVTIIRLIIIIRPIIIRPIISIRPIIIGVAKISVMLCRRVVVVCQRQNTFAITKVIDINNIILYRCLLLIT